MLEILFVTILVAFATFGIIYTFHNGSIFTKIIAKLEIKRDIGKWYAELFLCKLCLSVWVINILTICVLLINKISLWYFPIVAFAGIGILSKIKFYEDNN